MALPRLKMVAVKDHIFEREGGQWVRKTCPLGTGVVNLDRCLSTILRSGFHGVMSLHIEYPTGNPASDVERDFGVLRQKLQSAG